MDPAVHSPERKPLSDLTGVALAYPAPHLPSQLEFDFGDAFFPPRDGYQDQFIERRFRDTGQVSVPDMIAEREIAFLSKTTQLDQYYRLESPQPNLPSGVYRVRFEGEQTPLITIKIHGNGRDIMSRTIDVVSPTQEMIDSITGKGSLVCVIEKDRTTYKSRRAPNCLIHLDDVRGLGRFIDIKADSIDDLESFVSTLGLSNSPQVHQSYVKMREERGIDPFQLKVWQFHERFQDYIMGIVSGTLTPLGFLSAALASSQPKSALVIALLSAGLCDGLSDSVASSQATQSVSRASFKEQLSTFLTTIAGKIAIPITFIPIALLSESNTIILTLSSAWAATLIASTAAIQAIANERSIKRSVFSILSWGALATSVGSGVGYFVEKIFHNISKM